MKLIDGQLIREHVKQECKKYKSIFQASQKEVAIIRFKASENASNVVLCLIYCNRYKTSLQKLQFQLEF
jgi:5,10-methylene-tetrahydrofolate dehydrogenase/methenyl tetrahydrofolate cyclohydrolase